MAALEKKEYLYNQKIISVKDSFPYVTSGSMDKNRDFHKMLPKIWSDIVERKRHERCNEWNAERMFPSHTSFVTSTLQKVTEKAAFLIVLKRRLHMLLIAYLSVKDICRMRWLSLSNQARSKRSRFMTLFHAATKSCKNFSWESSHP